MKKNEEKEIFSPSKAQKFTAPNSPQKCFSPSPRKQSQSPSPKKIYQAQSQDVILQNSSSKLNIKGSGSKNKLPLQSQISLKKFEPVKKDPLPSFYIGEPTEILPQQKDENKCYLYPNKKKEAYEITPDSGQILSNMLLTIKGAKYQVVKKTIDKIN